MKTVLQTRLNQQLSLTPQLQQAIRLLQLSSQELLEEIQHGLETNPLLELQEEAEDKEDNINHDQQPMELYNSCQVSSTASKGSYQGDDNFTNDIKDTSDLELHEHLMWQMKMLSLTETDKAIATALIDAIDDAGYLDCSVEDIQQSLGEFDDPIGIDEIEAVLHRIQRFDPLGVGCRNLEEFLILQLDTLGNHDAIKHAKNIIINHLDLLAKHDFRQLRQVSHLREQQLAEAVELIQSLKPRPCHGQENTESHYVIPDVVIRKYQGKWIVELNADCTPRIQINPLYAKYAKENKNQPDTQAMREQLNEARWLLRSLESRNETLLKVATCIMNHQQAFLEQGPEAMKPLILQNIAEATELHESTISRITTQKFIQTPQGLFELKYFFSSQLQTNSGNGCSSTAIRAKIKNIIADEPGHKPYSDNKIATLLKEQHGIKIARRTVTKYREAMGIAPSNERKRIQTH